MADIKIPTRAEQQTRVQAGEVAVAAAARNAGVQVVETMTAGLHDAIGSVPQTAGQAKGTVFLDEKNVPDFGVLRQNGRSEGDVVRGALQSLMDEVTGPKHQLDFTVQEIRPNRMGFIVDFTVGWDGSQKERVPVPEISKRQPSHD